MAQESGWWISLGLSGCNISHNHIVSDLPGKIKSRALLCPKTGGYNGAKTKCQASRW
nr:MAG TPA: hypothetical protein [Caudoviricetes sp.]